MLAAMIVVHGLVLGSARVAGAMHGHGFVASQAADHAQETGAVSPDQTTGDLEAAADDSDGSDRSTHCPLCCAGASGVALPVTPNLCNIRPFKTSVVRFEIEAGHSIDPDGSAATPASHPHRLNRRWTAPL